MGKRIAILLADLNGGGVQKVMSILAATLAERGHAVDLVVCRDEGEIASQLSPRVNVVPLVATHPLLARAKAIQADPLGFLRLWRYIATFGKGSRSITRLPSLARYLKAVQPAVLLAATPFLNMDAVLARRLAGTSTRLVLSERSHFSSGKDRKAWRASRLAAAMSHAYRQADGIIAVSNGVADDLARTLGLDRRRITVIHNPTITPDLAARAAAAADHPWFASSEGAPASIVPVALAVGRPSHQKDYVTLLRAFAVLRAHRALRLAIIGETGNCGRRQRTVTELEALAKSLGIADDVSFLGWQANPLPFIARATMLCLSSRWEGLPNVLLEALACGTPVVSTDCPSGPREILADGRFGRLVPVGDHQAMAAAMLATLDAPPDAALLKSRAAAFDFDSAVDGYLEILLPGEPRLPRSAPRRRKMADPLLSSAGA